jgi:predicted MFS family arabinose efflux permease
LSTTDLPGASHLVSFRPLGLGALSAVYVLTFSGALAMPFNIQVLASQFQATNTEVGILASLELLAISFSSFFTARAAGRLNVRQGMLAGIVVVALANAATMLAPSLLLIGGIRIVAGLGAGPVLALVMSVAGRSNNPNVTFGVTNSAIGVMGMVLSVGIPTMIQMWGVAGVYGFYGVGALLALCLVGLVPVPAPIPRPAADAPRMPGLPLSAWLALSGLGLVFLGQAVLVMLIVRIGIDSQLSFDTIKIIFFIGSIATAAGPLAAGFLGPRLSTTLPMMTVLLLMVASAFVLANFHSPLPFILSGPAFAALPIILLPVMLSAFTAVDPSGRMAGTFPSFMTFAAAAGPFIGGASADLGGYSAVGWVSIGFLVVSGLMMLQIARRADAIRRESRA